MLSFNEIVRYNDHKNWYPSYGWPGGDADGVSQITERKTVKNRGVQVKEVRSIYLNLKV